MNSGLGVVGITVNGVAYRPNRHLVKALIDSLPDSESSRDLLKTEILTAIGECRISSSLDAFLRQHQVFGAFKYQIHLDGELFDAKALFIVGLRAAFPAINDLTVDDLPSQEKWVAEPLRTLGFEVIDKTATPKTTIVAGLTHVLNAYPTAHTQTF